MDGIENLNLKFPFSLFLSFIHLQITKIIFLFFCWNFQFWNPAGYYHALIDTQYTTFTFKKNMACVTHWFSPFLFSCFHLLFLGKCYYYYTYIFNGEKDLCTGSIQMMCGKFDKLAKMDFALLCLLWRWIN